MIRLIKNELAKIFSKKSFYIILLVIFGLIIFQNINFRLYYYEEWSEMEEELYNLQLSMMGINTNSYSGAMDFAYTAVKQDLLEDISDTYGNKSWQAYVILRDSEYIAYNIYYDYYLAQNFEDELSYFDFELNDEDKLLVPDKEQATAKYNELNEIFSSNDWRAFAKMQLSYLLEEKHDLDYILTSEYTPDLQNQIYKIETDIEVINTRLDKNIPFAYDYLNDAIDNYKYAKCEIYKIDNDTTRENTYENQKEYQNLVETFEKSNYIIQNKLDTENKDTTRYKLSSTFESSNQQLFILAIIVYISATIVSEEINNGTIKQLLTKPNNRLKILLSKLITCFIMIIFASILIPFMVYIANALFNETESLRIPMIMYNFSTSTLMEMDMIKYLFIQFLSKLPLFMIIMIIAFTLGTLFKNSIIAVLIPLFIYISGKFLIKVTTNNISILKFIPSTTWELNNVLFGRLHEFEGITLNLSIIVYLIYFILLLLISFIYFAKADIKNQ